MFSYLSNHQINYSDLITLIEAFFKIIEPFHQVVSLPSILNLKIFYTNILIRCGFLIKGERSFESNTQITDKLIKNEVDISKYYCLYTEYLCEYNQIDLAFQEFDKI